MSVKSNSIDHVAVIGGGIAGLACAFALVNRGAKVTVFERDRAGKAALWASGGMLAGVFESAEADAIDPFVMLARRGLELWRDWAAELGAEAIGYQSCGTLSPALGKKEGVWLEGLVRSARQQGFRIESPGPMPPWLKADESVLFPDDAALDNRKLGSRLVDHLRSRGVEIREGVRIDEISSDVAGEVFIKAEGELHRFYRAVRATGYDPAEQSSNESASRAVFPVKGQMVSLRAPGLRIEHCVRARDVYISQKTDGRVVIGATSEPRRDDLTVRKSAINGLRKRAAKLIPALRQADEIERWAGIRPATPDGLPIIGYGGMPGLCLATGLYRNGVLFSPAVAELVAASVFHEGKPPEAFSPWRFT
ncbi:FAD-dependent oxidoreductase [Hyphobacterium sp. HN65]|uniref:FAD-dependent oxidoreductase n=1 Tax=Hyphobacterium lacteum TaxID=3116575 RepID=A0ABU7LTE1_9PROT|nr:FAD-dependent oxidoreductase [Hyphobacterium sp. HN65]MEE2527177.1 FAD-dependent oxidoreductase [Hyphobacterium sp. HN65]